MRNFCRGVLILPMTLVMVIALTQLVAQGKDRTTLRVQGAACMASMVDSWAKSFMEGNPGVAVVVTGGKLEPGFTALLTGHAEIVMADRKISSDEAKDAKAHNVKLADSIVAWDGIVAVTDSANPMSELTLDQVDRIFTGDCSNWSEVGGPVQAITVFTGEFPIHGPTVFFWETVLRQMPFRSDVKVRRYYTNLLRDVAKIPGAIGYVGFNQLQSYRRRGKSAGIKTMKIKKDQSSPAVTPTRPTLADRSYPISRPLLLYWNAASEGGTVDRFVKYCVDQGR